MESLSLNKKGTLTIEEKNIFTILKKWLYTEEDIVFRELVSNGIDAVGKLKSETNNQSYSGKITVILDSDKKQLIVKDNGIGMTEEEVDKYINKIAFSGAAEFIENNNKKDTKNIIGHFGVGFYSSFMISDHVTIKTQSYKEDNYPVQWDCTSDMIYNIREIKKDSVGTEVILNLKDSSKYLKNPELVKNILEKYFVFSSTDVYYVNKGEEVKVNKSEPIWKKNEKDISVKDMNLFYQDFFDDVTAPLFWIKFESLDIGIRGILFFRNTKNGTEDLDGKIKVYNRGVYIGSNIKEMIPKFVNLQSGIIECDNLPLVVSRSNLREGEGDNILQLISETLSQEITIAMNSVFEKNRDKYELYWPEINAFMKYGILKDKIFASVMTRKIIFKDIYGNYQTIPEFLNDKNNNVPDKTVYYTSDEIDQAHYIEVFKKCGINALLFDHVIDQPFMQKYEVVKPGVKFIRIDSNIESIFKGSLDEDNEEIANIVKEKFENILQDRLDNTSVKVTQLAHQDISTLIINDEKSRRMTDMLEIYGFINPSDMASKKVKSKSTLLVNLNNKIIKHISILSDDKSLYTMINQLYDLSLMSQQALKPEDVENFILRSESILSKSIVDSK
ncbi:MAG: molecular chaperone HtpG [Tissierellales bacterium]|nr:molecular chaperone HtpG [Tissierellales bacterium]